MVIITGKAALESDNILDVIEKGLTKTEYQNYNGRIHASSAGYCARQGALQSTFDGNVTYEAKSAVYFKLGIALEETILDALDNQKRLLFRQYALPENPINLGGRIDGIVLHKDKIHCLEIKSCGTLPTKPGLEHASQLAVYSACTGLPGLLLYVSRHVQDHNGNIKMRLFDLGFDKERCEASLNNAATAYFAGKNNLMPDIPDYIHGPEDCGFCPFKSICWEFDTSPKLEFMSEDEKESIEHVTDDFIDSYMSNGELAKRRNGVLKYLSINGNKTAKFMLDGETWEQYLIEYL
jgi:hypothetical protein